MPNYRGRRAGTRRVVIWARGKALEWIVEGTKKEGDAFEARKRLELEASKLSTRTAPTFSDFCEHHFKPYAQTNLSASTWRNVYVYQLATLREFFGAKKLTDIGVEDVEQYKRLRLRADVGASSINNELKRLDSVLKYAAESGYPAARPPIRKLPTRGTSRARVWTVEELANLFTEARKESINLMRLFVFLANTGCRKGEALACEWSWIDFDAQMIRIPANDYWRPKNGKPREVLMSDACRAVLSGARESERWVFPQKSGGRYKVFPKGLFLRARDRAGLEGGAHTFRHTFASHFLQAVPDMFLLAQVLGHGHTQVTELYSHLLPDHLARARNAVNLRPSLQTMAPAMAAGAKTRNPPKKTKKRP